MDWPLIALSASIMNLSACADDASWRSPNKAYVPLQPSTSVLTGEGTFCSFFQNWIDTSYCVGPVSCIGRWTYGWMDRLMDE